MDTIQPSGWEDNSSLALQAKTDPDAMAELIKKNEKLIRFVANKMRSPYSIQMEDLLQEGAIGMIKAVRYFDPEQGEFSTYAVFWIRQAITRFIWQNDMLKIPAYYQEKKIKILQFNKEYLAKYGTEPTVEQVVEAVGTTPEIVKTIKGFCNTTVASLEATFSKNGDDYLKDFVQEESLGPEDTVAAGMMKQDINTVLEMVLTERERFVVERRFGLNGNDEMTLQQIGTILGITREGVRYIEKKAIAKIRSSKKCMNMLTDYLSQPEAKEKTW